MFKYHFSFIFNSINLLGQHSHLKERKNGAKHRKNTQAMILQHSRERKTSKAPNQGYTAAEQAAASS